MEYGILPDSAVDARYGERAERMCVHAGSMLGLSFLPKAKWFVPVTAENRGLFQETFSWEPGLLGLERPTAPGAVLVAYNQPLDDAMLTVGHEVFHAAGFSDERLADEFAAEAMESIDWSIYSDEALEWLTKLPAKSPTPAKAGDGKQDELKASLRRVGRRVKTYAEQCARAARNPRASRTEVEATHRRVQEWATRFDILAKAVGVATLEDSPPYQANQ